MELRSREERGGAERREEKQRGERRSREERGGAERREEKQRGGEGVGRGGEGRGGKEKEKRGEERRSKIKSVFKNKKNMSARLELTSPATSALEFLHMSLEKREIMGSSLPNVKGYHTR